MIELTRGGPNSRIGLRKVEDASRERHLEAFPAWSSFSGPIQMHFSSTAHIVSPENDLPHARE